MAATELVLTLSCPDRPGIVHAVSGFLAARDCNIVDSQQFRDPDTGRFFMRVGFHPPHPLESEALAAEFTAEADRFRMSWELHDTARKMRLLILVSREGHCLNDLLYRWRVGAHPVDIRAVASNHPDFADLVAGYGLRYEQLPVTPQTRAAQEARLLGLVAEEAVDLVVLARYMQVLSAPTCERLAGRIINIHHSFLPSFVGAQPYRQAHDRGVKLIGATAHYVTAELDAGPIIEQDVARVDHRATPAELAAVGRDVESLVLARAVRWHVEHRVLLDGRKTVVFS